MEIETNYLEWNNLWIFFNFPVFILLSFGNLKACGILEIWRSFPHSAFRTKCFVPIVCESSIGISFHFQENTICFSVLFCIWKGRKTFRITHLLNQRNPLLVRSLIFLKEWLRSNRYVLSTWNDCSNRFIEDVPWKVKRLSKTVPSIQWQSTKTKSEMIHTVQLIL